MRPVPGKRDPGAGLPLVGSRELPYSWVGTELCPTTLAVWTFSVFFSHRFAPCFDFFVSFAALIWFASLGYSWFDLPRTLLKAHFCHVTCGEDERRDIIFTEL